MCLCLWVCSAPPQKVCSKLSRHPVLKRCAHKDSCKVLTQTSGVSSETSPQSRSIIFTFIKAQFEHINFELSSTFQNKLTTKTHLLLLHLLLFRGIGRPSPQHLLLQWSFKSSLDKKPWESDTPVLISEGFCRCAATAKVVRLKKNTEGGRAALRCSKTKCRSLRGSHVVTEKTEEANPVFGTPALLTVLWVCYMYVAALRATISPWL